MGYNFSLWPTVDDVMTELSAGNITVPAAITEDYVQARIDAATSYVFQQTRRFFVADVIATARVYDGNGTGTMEIDEYLEIDKVEFVFFPTIASTTVTTWYAVSHIKWPKTRIQIYQGPSNATYAIYPVFPYGRSNILVTGRFGYDDTIPADLWLAVLNDVTGKIVNVLASAAQDGQAQMGQTLKWTEGYESEQYNSGLAGDQLGWTTELKKACKRYSSQVARRVGKGTQNLW